MQATTLARRLESLMRKALYDFDLIDGEPLGIALSGGKDSLTLLHLLNCVKGRGFPNFELHAFHVSGAFSCGPGMQSKFLSPLCEKLNVPLHIAETDQKLETLECYSCSRRRRKLLFDMARREGVSRLAFGHHRDDNAQTLLMNLLHKAEFEPMAPKIHMRAYGCTIIRPLIYIPENSIRTFAEQNGFARITCQCPVGTNSKRRKTEVLLETIERLYPNARSNLHAAGFAYGKKFRENLLPLEAPEQLEPLELSALEPESPSL